MVASLKPLNPCGLQIHYLYTRQAEIRFDKTCEERVHVVVTRLGQPGCLLFGGVLKTEEAREIYRELCKRGAASDPLLATY
jgi:hypothetical protein